jgi:hypothetical protein
MAIQLGTVKQNMPLQNPALQAQQKADLQLQQAASTMGAQTLTPQKAQIQQAATQVAQVRNQEQTKAVQQNVQQAAQTRSLQDNEERMAKVKETMAAKQKVQADSLKNAADLDALGLNLKSQYVDNVTKFKKDELGRTIMNGRQLSDWAVLKAKNEEEYAEYEQMMLQAIEKKQAVMDHAFKVVSQHLDQEFQKAEQAKDSAYLEQISVIKQNLEKQRSDAKHKAARDSSLWVTGGTVIGTVAGGIIGAFAGGVGAAPGAAIGGSLGAAAGGLMASQQD